jgi:hypothetical protein
MQKDLPHYGDILKKAERIIESCVSTEQIGSAWRFADLFEEHCKRIGVNDKSRMIMRSTLNNLLEDKWETVRLEKLNRA